MTETSFLDSGDASAEVSWLEWPSRASLTVGSLGLRAARAE